MTETIAHITETDSQIDPVKAADSLLTEQKLTIPTDVYKLAADLKYKVYELDEADLADPIYKNFESFSAVIQATKQVDKSKYLHRSIIINKGLNPLKKRFVLAREIGCLRMGLLSVGNYIIRRADIEANDYSRKPSEEFAFELLMPKDEVLKLYNQIATPYLEPFIDHFKLSAMTIQDRFKQLGLRFL